MRFRFGRNWRSYSQLISEESVAVAGRSITALTGEVEGADRLFLDIGCGSGLFSASASRMGFRVHGFDYDEDSVSTSRETMLRFAPDRPWVIERGDVLDDAYMDRVPVADFVYAWGVLHHTGDLWQALENALAKVDRGGTLVLAIYNDQGFRSTMWRIVKRLYVRFPLLRPLLLVGAFFVQWWRPLLDDLRHRRGFLSSWRHYSDDDRAMSAWHDLRDWVGGYPFEVASIDETVTALSRAGFEVVHVEPVPFKGSGNNQYVARKLEDVATPDQLEENIANSHSNPANG